MVVTTENEDIQEEEGGTGGATKGNDGTKMSGTFLDFLPSKEVLSLH